MDRDDIKPIMTYEGGKNGDLRTVIDYGATKKWVRWAPTRERLPLGGFVNAQCSLRASFAKWAIRAVPQRQDSAELIDAFSHHPQGDQ